MSSKLLAIACLGRALIARTPLQALPSNLSWRAVARALREHPEAISSFSPLLLGADPPAPLRSGLERSFQRRRAIIEGLLAEVVRLTPRFEAVGIRPVLLKGPALGASVYPARAMRLFSDIDLLLTREEMGRAGAVLREAGYQPAAVLADRAFYERHHFHHAFQSRDGCLVELHWDLTRPADYYRLAPEGVLRRAGEHEIDGARVRIPAGSDQLLHAAAQCFDGEGFDDLRRVLDAALLLHAGAGTEPGLIERAHAQHMATLLWLLLEVARVLTGVAVPPELEAGLRPPPAVRVMLQSLRPAEIFASRHTHRWNGIKTLLRILCAPDGAVAAREIWRSVLVGEDVLLEMGHRPGALPGVAQRASMSLRRAWSLAKVGAYQGGMLALAPARGGSAQGEMAMRR